MAACGKYLNYTLFLAVLYLTLNAGFTEAEAVKESNPNSTGGAVAAGAANSNVGISSTATSKLVNPLSTPTNSTPSCVCDGVLLPRVGADGKVIDICPECKCHARNTTLIKVVVIIVIWIISILVIYMLFLMCLDPLLNKRVKANYQEHTNEDDDGSTTSPQASSTANQELSARANVLNRVGHQTDKWKRQVREQRRHIYDRRTMLN